MDAVPQAVTSVGYADLTVERVLAAGGVSRSTFYQHFSTLDDCFLAAYRLHAQHLVIDVSAGARSRGGGALSVLAALLEAAARRPHTALFLMREGLASGPTGLAERDALISSIAVEVIRPSSRQPVIDLPPEVLLGGVFRFLAMRSEDAGATGDDGRDVLEWASAFARLSSERSWCVLLSPRASDELVPTHSGPHPNHTLPRGGRRERIIQATAASIRETGFRAMTVSDIVGRACVSRRGFYNEFRNKSDAFMAAYEYGFQQCLSACAPAFFAAREWPERVWHAAEAFSRFLLREPLISYLGFVDCYSVGPSFTERVHDTQLAFTMFLEDGYRQRPEAHSFSRGCSALTAATIFEAGFRGLRSGSVLQVRSMQPLAVYLALVPFIGRDQAGDFVIKKLAKQHRDRSS
jgi:AcrR family transcriptional regulator